MRQSLNRVCLWSPSLQPSGHNTQLSLMDLLSAQISRWGVGRVAEEAECGTLFGDVLIDTCAAGDSLLGDHGQAAASVTANAAA